MLATDEKQEKGLIGPGKVDQNVKGEGVLVSDSLNSEQGKQAEGKYLQSRAVSEMSDSEQDKFFAEGLDPLEVSRVLEASKKNEKGHLQGAKGVGVNVSMAKLHGANVAASDVAMGAGRVEACPNGRPDPPMTMPQGHEQELMSGCGELTGSSVSLEVAMSEGHAIVDVIPSLP